MPDTYDFEIYFFGLICIHGQYEDRGKERKNKVTALLLEDGDHERRIYVRQNISDFSLLDTDTSVSFGKLPGGPAEVLPSFDALVPHLEDLTDESVTLYKDAHGTRVTLPGGLLATVDQYNTKSEYTLNSFTLSFGCVGRITLLQVKTAQPDVVVKFYSNSAPKYVAAPSDGWILIANMELNRNDGTAMGFKTWRNDFEKHKGFTKTSTEFAKLYEWDREKCNIPISNPVNIKATHLPEILSIVGNYPVFAHPECSNTNWP